MGVKLIKNEEILFKRSQMILELLQGCRDDARKTVFEIFKETKQFEIIFLLCSNGSFWGSIVTILLTLWAPNSNYSCPFLVWVEMSENQLPQDFRAEIDFIVFGVEFGSYIVWENVGVQILAPLIPHLRDPFFKVPLKRWNVHIYVVRKPIKTMLFIISYIFHSLILFSAVVNDFKALHSSLVSHCISNNAYMRIKIQTRFQSCDPNLFGQIPRYCVI